MDLRINVTSKSKKLSGLKFLQDNLTKATASKLIQVAEHALKVATEGTPKWSGHATEGWRISLVPRSGYTDTSSWMIGKPKYEGGIHDPDAAKLNAEVVKREMSYLRSVLSKQLRKGNASFFLVNDVKYSSQWLGGDAASFLREVNRDYYSIKDIEQEIHMFKFNQSLGWS